MFEKYSIKIKDELVVVKESCIYGDQLIFKVKIEDLEVLKLNKDLERAILEKIAIKSIKKGLNSTKNKGK
jgi:hypothetical protein